MYLKDGSAQTSLRAATLRQKLQIKLSTSPSHSILTPGRLVPTLTLSRKAPGRVDTGVPIFKSQVCLDPEQSRRKRESNPVSAVLETDALTTRPTRRSDPTGEGENRSRDPPRWRRTDSLPLGRRTGLCVRDAVEVCGRAAEGPASRLALSGQRWDWLARCKYTVAG